MSNGRLIKWSRRWRDGRRKAAGRGVTCRSSRAPWRYVVVAALGLAISAETGECKEGAIQCANLIYAGTHTSRCFSDEFLSDVQARTTIPTERRFKSVKLASDELFSFPFVIMTGESEFFLSGRERENLRRYVLNGGFLLASAGCSSKEWDKSFRREMRVLFPDRELTRVPMTHTVFRTVYEVGELTLQHPAEEAYLEGVTVNGKLVICYSGHGLNDTSHTEGCCCCGGNEITNSMQMNVNILTYALMY